LIGQIVVSFERCFLKGEAPEFATGFDHPLSCERPFKWYQMIPLPAEQISLDSPFKYSICCSYSSWNRGLYIGKYPPPLGKISADVIWGEKYEKGKRKMGKM
jgi:hypothetical protein